MSEQLQDIILNDFSWKERKANEDAIRIALNKQPKRGRYKKFIDKMGNNLWHYWAYYKNPEEIYEKWINRLSQEDINLKNNKGEHVLHRLALCGKYKAIELLLNNNDLDFNVVNLNKETLLHYACWSGCSNTIKLILNKHPELIDSMDDEGYTPLTIAINRCDDELVNELIMIGANPNIQDIKGKTALHYTAEKGNFGLYEKLEGFGGDNQIKDKTGKTPESIIEKSIERTNEENLRYNNFWKNKYHNKLLF